jgi:hypothetical protein
MYSEREYIEYAFEPRKAKWYFHRRYEFHIIIFEDGSVYQLGTECNTIGVELKDIESLVIRFESFTGEDITNIRLEEGEDACEMFGHDWRYNFPSLPNKRICAICKKRETFDGYRLDWLDVPFQDSRSEEELINGWFK